MQQVKNQIQMIYESYNCTPGCLSIIKNKEPILTLCKRSYPQEFFKLASITKLFTQIVILQLYDKGELNIYDRIEKYTDKVSGIRIIDLMKHNVGDRISVDGKPEYNFDTRYIKYSNVGYEFLGYIIESVTEMDYIDYVQENIFDVLDMRNSMFAKYGASKITMLNDDIEHSHPAGGIATTIMDMHKFINGFDRLIKNPEWLLQFWENWNVFYGVEKCSDYICYFGDLDGHFSKLLFDKNDFPDGWIILMESLNGTSQYELVKELYEYLQRLEVVKR